MKMEVLSVQNHIQGQFGVIGTTKVKDWTSPLTPPPTTTTTTTQVAVVAAAPTPLETSPSPPLSVPPTQHQQQQQQQQTHQKHHQQENKTNNKELSLTQRIRRISGNTGIISSTPPVSAPHQHYPPPSLTTSTNKNNQLFISEANFVDSVINTFTTDTGMDVVDGVHVSGGDIGVSGGGTSMLHTTLFATTTTATTGAGGGGGGISTPSAIDNNKLLHDDDDVRSSVAVQELSQRLQAELRAAKSRHLSCTEVTLPFDLTPRIAAEIIRMSEREPCGERACTIFIEFESEPNNIRRIASFKVDPNTVSIFELYLTLKQDKSGWTSLLPQFLKNLTRSNTIMISPDFSLTKNKLYSDE